MDAPVIRDGAVLFRDGIIRAVGPAADLRAEYPRADVMDMGRATLLPGLVNAHVHLELSSLSNCGSPAGTFVDWLLRLVPRGPMDAAKLEQSVAAAVAQGVGECLRFGVTAVGDISRQCALTRPILRVGPLRVVSYGEVLAMGQRRTLLDERMAVATDRANQSAALRVGISPHAPYSIEDEGYRRCLAAARSGRLPIATHLAETRNEREFLDDHAGPFRDLWQQIGGWDDHVPRFAGGPIRFAREVGLLDYPTLLAHVNYCDAEELAMLAAGQASVVYCPRTHAYFDHPPHRWREMLAGGINVAVGTDSTASSPDLNLVDDLRLLHRLAPDFPPARLWELATWRAARAIQWDQHIGSLAPGKAADMVVFPIAGNDPLSAILEEDVRPQALWIGGQLQSIR
jgi:cytosine/adenosine deaminase-related metal-dependent hydrolase